MRIVIGEDLFLLRDGLVRLLTAHGFEIAAAVGTAPELLQALTAERPDVGIVDVRLPPTHTDDGLRAALAARRQVPGLPVLGRSNAAIAQRLFITEKAVSKHAAGIFGKLDLVPSDDNRRLLAVLAYLGS